MLYSYNCQLHDKQSKDLKSQGFQNLIHNNQQNHNYAIRIPTLHYDITVGALVNWLITCPNIIFNYLRLYNIFYSLATMLRWEFVVCQHGVLHNWVPITGAEGWVGLTMLAYVTNHRLLPVDVTQMVYQCKISNYEKFAIYMQVHT